MIRMLYSKKHNNCYMCYINVRPQLLMLSLPLLHLFWYLTFTQRKNLKMQKKWMIKKMKIWAWNCYSKRQLIWECSRNSPKFFPKKLQVGDISRILTILSSHSDWEMWIWQIIKETAIPISIKLFLISCLF